MRLITSAVVASLIVIGGITSHDELSDHDLHPDIQYALERVPGGVLVDERTVIWPAHDMLLEVPLEARAVAGCADDSVCAFSQVDGGGTKLQWGSCGTHSTTALSVVRSIANARSGTLQARQGTTVRASASVGSWTNVPAAYVWDITNVKC